MYDGCISEGLNESVTSSKSSHTTLTASMTSSFASLSSSFTNALAYNNDSGSIASGGIYGERQGSVASERSPRRSAAADIVANDPRLKKLLAEEVEKAGVVTTGAYNAVFQKFLTSEEVKRRLKDQDEPEARPERRKRSSRRRQQQQGLMGRLVSSLTSETSGGAGRPYDDCKPQEIASFSRSLTKADPRFNVGDKAPGGDNDTGSLSRSLADFDPRCRGGNMAPRKMDSFRSGSRRATTGECLKIDDALHLKALRENHEENYGKGVSKRRAAGSRKRESLDLGDVFDGTEGSKQIPPTPLPHQDANSDGGLFPLPQEIADVFDSFHRSGSESFHERDFRHDKQENIISFHDKKKALPEQGNDAIEKGKDGSVASEGSQDDCGWLPWPDKEEGEERGTARGAKTMVH